MVNNNLKELLNFVKTTSSENYPKLFNLVEYLKRERIKFVGNDLRNYLEIENKVINKDEIVDTIKKINEISKLVNFDLCIPTKWEDAEKYLRYTILEDLGEEFKKQGN